VTHVGKVGASRVSVGNFERWRLLGRPRRIRWILLKSVVLWWSAMWRWRLWMYLAKDRDHWCPVVKMIPTLRVAYKTEDILYLLNYLGV